MHSRFCGLFQRHERRAARGSSEPHSKKHGMKVHGEGRHARPCAGHDEKANHFQLLEKA
jgi:hypothetical protein